MIGVAFEPISPGVESSFIYSTSTYQAIPSGGPQNRQHLRAKYPTFHKYRHGAPRALAWRPVPFRRAVPIWQLAAHTFTAGSFVPQYAGLVLPGPLLSHDIYPSEFFRSPLSPKFSVVLGKINNVFIPDQTLFGDSYKYYFANFNFNNNPMNPMIYRPTDLTAVLPGWAPKSWLTFAGGVLDPNTTSNTFAAHAFNKVDLYLASIIHYQVGGLPGQISPAFNWTNKPKINLDSPYGPLSWAQIPQAVAVLLGSPFAGGLKINYKHEGFFVIGNFSQYLYVKDNPENIAGKLKSGQPLNGIGAFVRVGFAQPGPFTVTTHGSVALFANGLFDSRKYDSFGSRVFTTTPSAAN